MPSFQIHLAIAKRYIEKHNVIDKEGFIEGSIEPDFVRPKEKSHYTIEIKSDNLEEHLKGKVDINRFLNENEIKTDYDRGVLLHLLTDKIFFTEFFDNAYIKSVTYQKFCEDLYISYSMTNTYLEKKYPVKLKQDILDKMNKDIEKSRKEKKVTQKQGEQIISLKRLDNFIERMSDINLEEYEFNK